MLKTPVTPKGKWVMKEDGLRIYDGIGNLFDHITDIDKAMAMINLLWKDEFKMNSEGEQTYFETDELKEMMEEQWKYYHSHCTECEKPLPKTRPHYSYKGMCLCTRCYNKKDTWFNVTFKAE